jgi:hypothetical protein
MPRKIILVGGLADEPRRDAFLERLRSEVSDGDEWVWIYSREVDSFQPNNKSMNRLLDELRKWLAANKKADSIELAPRPEPIVVVKLVDLHGRAANQLFSIWHGPILVPKAVRTSDQLVPWLKSPESGLFPPREWYAGLTEAALVSILCKLLKRKSWNPDVHGHAWTMEEHLLTESPVVRSDRPKVAIEAGRLLPTLEGRLLLTKGGGQGKTPREWSIDTKFLAAIKRAVTASSVTPLEVFPCLKNVLERVARETQKPYRLDGVIVNERVIFICRER